jgi:hypothetical protein
MYNFRETTDLTHDCTSCVSFTSYQIEYEDELEPSEYGRCAEDVADGVGEGMICDLWKCRYSIKK